MIWTKQYVPKPFLLHHPIEKNLQIDKQQSDDH